MYITSELDKYVYAGILIFVLVLILFAPDNLNGYIKKCIRKGYDIEEKSNRSSIPHTAKDKARDK